MMPDDLVRRGQQAQTLLNDPLLKEAFDAMSQDCYAQWQTSPPDDTARREHLYLMSRLLGGLKAHLHSLVLDGRLAEQRLEDMP